MITDIRRSLLDDATHNDFAGFDPFDGLNARLFDVFPRLRNSLFGLAWIQIFKRSNINMRHLLGVPKKRNPKGVALFISGMLEQYQTTHDTHLLEEAQKLADWLLEHQCCSKTWGASCWGYHFDWKARAFFVPKGKPNVISTIYVSRALFDLGKLTNNQRYVDAACSSAEFIVEHLYTEDQQRQFFAYIPGEKAFVHNASLWAAAWVGFVGSETDNAKYKELARTVAWQSINEQSPDGSWVYGARSHHQFIDGFHTGYNLEALYELKHSLQTNEFDESIDHGLVYYKAHLFEEDGTAKYYNNNRYPLDPHSVAQAVITLIKVGGEQDDLNMAGKVLNWSVKELYLSDKKQFVYQKTVRTTNAINYVRWTQAWMYLSMSIYLKNQKGEKS